MEKFIMLKREEKQVAAILEQLLRKEITQKGAAERLNLTDRQIRNKLAAYKVSGLESLVHGNRGRKSKTKWDPAYETFAIDLLKGPWAELEMGPTLAAEQLLEHHKIRVSPETLRKVMIRSGIWALKRQIQMRRRRRERRTVFGVMIQLDGSPHNWFGPDHPKCTLLVFIDDATSKLVWLEFVKSESLEGVMRATKSYMESYGIPVSFYVDYGSVFSVNVNNKERTKITQFERAMKELGVEMIHARSPQAKGRVERSNRTHQDRLVKLLRMAKITTMEEANKFLPGYIIKHNSKFAVEAHEQGDAHKPTEGYKLDEILSELTTRKLQNDYTVLYKKRVLQLVDKQTIRYKPKDSIMIRQKLDGSLILSIRGNNLEFEELKQRPEKQIVEKTYTQKAQIVSENSRRWNMNVCKPKPYIQQPAWNGGF
jgi:hypothetical protein